MKTGDNVQLQPKKGSYDLPFGTKGKVKAVPHETYVEVVFEGNSSSRNVYTEDLKLIEQNMSKNIKDSFTLAFKAEPEKSFRKTGVTNGDDFLTEDGQKIFLSWLLKKMGVDFKKEVVDGLLEEMEKDNN